MARTSNFALLRPTPLRLLALALAAIAPALLIGCAGGGRADRPRSAITIDGDIADWPEDVVAVADANYVYLRFRVAGTPGALQASPETLSILLDADDNRATGAPIAELPAASSMGVDLEIQFSPMTDSGTPATGVSVIAIDATGATERLSHADIDFHFSPTYASDWYEARLSRQATGSGLLAPGILKGRSLRGVLGLYDAAGNISGASAAFSCAMPPASSGRAPAAAPVPPAPRSAVRVVSYNVLRGSPASNPAPFARVFLALNPDIVLLQEWDAEADVIRAWFDQNLPEHAPWSVATSAGPLRTAIVSRHPIAGSTGDGTLTPGVRPVGSSEPRFVAAIVRTPQGDVLAGSAHLKCCGSSTGPEDARRIEEAHAINAAVGTMARRSLAFMVVGGDLNLVGTRTPLDVLRAGIDADGSDLDIVPAPVLGDAAHYTWYEAQNQFSPGRLDWMVVGDAQARIARSFVLNTEILSDQSLTQAGLERGDSRASDHMPVVVDLLRR